MQRERPLAGHMTSRSVSREARFGPLACRHGADDAQASPGPWMHCGGGPAFKQGFTWLRFRRTPVPPRLFVASSSGGSVVLFGSRYSVQPAPERHGQMRRSSRPRRHTSLHTCKQRSRTSESADDDRRRRTLRPRDSAPCCSLGDMIPAGCACAHNNGRLLSDWRLRQGWIGCDTSFRGSGGRGASLHGCTPRYARQTHRKLQRCEDCGGDDPSLINCLPAPRAPPCHHRLRPLFP
jgi:hypothetical protein